MSNSGFPLLYGGYTNLELVAPGRQKRIFDEKMKFAMFAAVGIITASVVAGVVLYIKKKDAATNK
jgi:hypothetical protein